MQGLQGKKGLSQVEQPIQSAVRVLPSSTVGYCWKPRGGRTCSFFCAGQTKTRGCSGRSASMQGPYAWGSGPSSLRYKCNSLRKLKVGIHCMWHRQGHQIGSFCSSDKCNQAVLKTLEARATHPTLDALL
eukprot:1136313-Pelagomonas_calceolata.AAC.17